MKIKADANGFIESYATFGSIVDSTEIEMPMDLDHFERNYRAYRIKN